MQLSEITAVTCNWYTIDLPLRICVIVDDFCTLLVGTPELGRLRVTERQACKHGYNVDSKKVEDSFRVQL